jgi:hypothetical protein
VMSLVAVVGLAKVLSPSIERAVIAAGAPKTLIGIAIAMLCGSQTISKECLLRLFARASTRCCLALML